jgi:O-antigen biosynthesis protein
MIFYPIKVMDCELSEPLRTITGLEDYGFLQLVVRFHGSPIGYIKLPVINGSCTASSIGQAVLKKYKSAIIHHLFIQGLITNSDQQKVDLPHLLKKSPVSFPEDSAPLITVAVCSRDRTADLSHCLSSLTGLNYPQLDLVIVDNAPTTDATQRLVSEEYPHIRYIREVRPGLNWGRNRAILEARGEIIAFTDDDVVVDPDWVTSLSAIFSEHPEVMAVTGLVVPSELETEAQELFELYGGFGRGFKQQWLRVSPTAGKTSGFYYHGTGKFGTGANMAYRRQLFEKIGYFDPALDVGTVTDGGGDLEMFFRVLKKGFTLVYEPKAIVRHFHRREYKSLCNQMDGWGTGFISYMIRSSSVYPEERRAFFRLGAWWFFYKIRSLMISLMFPNPFRDLCLAELKGCFKGLLCYHRAQSTVAQIIKEHGRPEYLDIEKKHVSLAPFTAPSNKEAIRIIDINKPLTVLADVTDYHMVRLYVQCDGEPIGIVNLPTYGQPLSLTRLRQGLGDYFYPNNLHNESKSKLNKNWAEYTVKLEHYLEGDEGWHRLDPPDCLPDDYSASIIVATYDRPQDLQNCLTSIVNQNSTRKKEIIVIDNNPTSGLTPPILDAFPEVVLVNEARQGLSYARNAGIRASKGDIVITIDDDVFVPPDWLEKVLAPFVRNDVMVVTGNVLPMELETEAQHLFEKYGGLGKGFEPQEADQAWFRSFSRALPTWKLGATANAAFRSCIFNHPEIGMFDEALGAGTPTGCSEDTYVFYKVLKAGYTIIYEPKAYVFHKHRRSMSAFKSQIYNYSKGHVAYHLTTLFSDHDLRAFVRLFVELPPYHIKRLIRSFLGRGDYPISLILREIAGNLAGFLALFQSRWRVRHLGASEPYIPVIERLKDKKGEISPPCQANY